MSTGSVQQLTDHLFRREAGKLVSVLTRIFGTENLELAEDVVQETFMTALKVWPLKGMPDKPEAWLYRVARNKAVDVLRQKKHLLRLDLTKPHNQLLLSEYTLENTMDHLWKEELIKDDLLRMMFACCHPDLSAENQVTLMLKTLCGFSTAEIARAFVTGEDTISKRLYRSKEFFRENNTRPEFPPQEEITERTHAVLKTIYLLFNEGYNSTHSDQIIRRDLIEQAMYLCRLLCNNSHTHLPQPYAAMALMCFHAARLESRLGKEGEIVLLAFQDRSKWNYEMINEGNEYLAKASFGEGISEYHIEAAIAFEHCVAPDFESTNWQRILEYYNWLVKINANAVTELNRMTVLNKIAGPDETLKEIEKSEWKTAWEKHYLYHALLGDIYAQTGNKKAITHYDQAINLTLSEAERKLLRRKIEGFFS